MLEPRGRAGLAALFERRYEPDPDDVVAVVLTGASTTAVGFDP